MSNKKVTTQKVSGALKKAGMHLHTGQSRFSSGLMVRGIYAGYKFIEVSYVTSSHSSNLEPPTEIRVGKLSQAADVLTQAGLIVLVKLPKATDDLSSRALTLYIPKDPESRITDLEGAKLFDAAAFSAYFMKEIEEEKKSASNEKAIKDEKAAKAATAQAERLAQAKFLNPIIPIDHNYMAGLFTTHVTLLDGRMAVVTVAYIEKEDWDWKATSEAKEDRM